jgi:hypothetical protein
VPKKPTVFISCGQFTDEEKQLGAGICRLVEELTPFRAYFAENQTSLEGLTKNILEALSESVGLIAVLHPRGTVSYASGGSHTRASVWVEQEIAIAAYLSQIVGRNLNTAAFVHESVAREGMRDQLLLNPRKFKTNSDVLDHLRGVLPGWSTKSVPKVGLVKLTMKFNKIKVTSERHDYELQIDVTNNTKGRIGDFQVDLFFPDAFLNQTMTYGEEVHDRRTRSHRLFRVVASHGMFPIYPGDTLSALKLAYYVDHDIFWNKSMHLDDKVTATLYAPGQEPETLEKSMRELQQF